MENKTKLEYLFNKTWKTYKENFKTFSIILLIFQFLPYTIYNIYSILTQIDESLIVNELTQTLNWNIIIQELIKHSALSLILFLINMVGLVTILYILLKNKKTKTIKEAVKKSSKYYLRLIGLTALVFILLIPLYALLIIPGIIFSVYWMFAQYIIVDKDEKIIKSMKQSFYLVKNNWWKTFGKILLIGLIAMIIMMTITITIGTTLIAIEGKTAIATGLSTTSQIISILITNATQLLVTLFIVIFAVHLYEGLKNKKENKKIKK
ncbi:glycerophosphoryl diester phosphodiesterase membrane domain-containing protein [Candidatus Woesearchaeota archaeon]|nr:glycerophosphoryl diester phosphodiesterase membrane domain-containing protein [Candidatus Woesearchaeota archaeon]